MAAESLVDPWWAWMLEASVLGGAALLVAAGIDRFAPRPWLFLRSAVWAAALVRLLLPPSWSAAVVSAAPLLGRTTLPEADTGGTLRLTLFAVWAFGVAGGCVWTCARHRRFARDQRVDALGGVPSTLERSLRRAAAEVGVRAPSVRLVPGAVGPATFGLARPVVVLPADLAERWSAREVRHVLLHELVHVRRRDPLRGALVWMIQVLFWFDPLVWIARARLEAVREHACDAEVAAILRGESDDYRRTLAAFALAAEPALRPTAASFGGGARIVRRLEFLELAARRPGGAAVRGLGLTAGLVLLAGSLPAPFQLTAAEALEQPGCLTLRYHVFGAMGESSPGAVPSPNAGD